jgi:hypothetical protein
MLGIGIGRVGFFLSPLRAPVSPADIKRAWQTTME